MAREKFYGVRAIEQPTSIATPFIAMSGIVIAFGTAPIHQVDGEPNTVVVASSYNEAVAALGYSDNWEKYTLCEVMHSHFKLYNASPLLLVNVLDPAEHQSEVGEQEYDITNDQIVLSGDALAETIEVKNEGTTYTAGSDYDVFYENDTCIIEILPDGQIDEAGLTKATVKYSEVSFDLDDMKDEVIGGYDIETGKSRGLELMDVAYFAGRILPDILIAPGFSHHSEVAAVMAAKTTFSTVFRASCICDIDTEKAKTGKAAVELKNKDKSFQSNRQILCWPMVKYGDQIFWYSTQLAGMMCATDARNGDVPAQVASNLTLYADSAVLKDGTQILLDLTQANYLRANGLVTAYNFINGFTSWGVYNACYPQSIDPKDQFINISRMFGYIANSAILTFWRRIDEKLTPRYAESIIDEMNMWINGLVAGDQLLGARCELKSEENPVTDLIAGIVRIHIYMAPPSPAQEIDFLLEYDTSYVASAFGIT